MKRILYIALLATMAIMPVAANAETSADTGAKASTQATAGASLSRSEIIQIQQALNTEGFYKGRADGVWGPNTANAVQKFQASHEINANGNLDAATLDQLGVNLSMNAATDEQTDFNNRESRRGSTVNPGNGTDAAASAENSGSTGSDMSNPATSASSPEQRSIGGVDLSIGAAGSGND